MKAFFPKIVRMNNDSQLEWDVDREKLQKHAIRVMQGLGAAVESLDDSDFLNSVLISVGQTHFHRQVRPTMLKVIKFPFKRKGLTSQNVRFLKSLLEDTVKRLIFVEFRGQYQFAKIKIRKIFSCFLKN